MGRHSASYIAAQQAGFAARRATSAAGYVGRVGGLALALGVGAAVVGGAGLANAEGTADGGASDAGPTSASTTSPGHDSAGATATDDPKSETTPPTSPQTSETAAPAATAKPHEPSRLDVPKMVFVGGVPTHRPEATTADEDPLPGLPEATPSEIELDVTPVGPRRNNHTDDARQAKPDASVASVVRTKADEPAAPVHAAAAHIEDEPTAAPTGAGRQLVTASPTAASAAVVSLAAPVTATPVQQPPRAANPIATIVSGVLNALGFSPSATAGGTPVTPFPILHAVLQLIHREIENFVINLHAAADFYSSSQVHVPPANATTIPAPGDQTSTVYGDIGKWMLEPSGQISDYGGQPYGGKALLEPVNVIIVDPKSTTPEAAAARLNTAMFWSGFPAQPIHSTGFQGEIDDVVYGQQPTGLLQGYSDNLFFFTNDHGRIFGPDPVETSTGYVWSGAFSTEALTIYDFLPAHAYVSSESARTALAMHLILSGQAAYVGMVPLDNAVDTATTTTGDHDGYAVVLELR